VRLRGRPVCGRSLCRGPGGGAFGWFGGPVFGLPCVGRLEGRDSWAAFLSVHAGRVESVRSIVVGCMGARVYACPLVSLLRCWGSDPAR